MSSAITALLGNTLINAQQASVKTADALSQADFVALYFSASWCGPCRQFTPKLVDFYKKHHASKKLEIVFVSSDSDEGSFKQYFGKMPWLAVPFEDDGGEETRQRLGSRFKVQGIPTFILVDALTGDVACRDARTEVLQDPEAAQFPWKMPSLKDVLSGVKLLPGAGAGSAPDAPAKDALLGVDVLGLYFSAHWCPPCQRFTPVLAECYRKLREQGKSVEVVYVPGDKSAKEFDEYRAHMPWPAVPFDDQKTSNALKKIFDVEGYPTLVFINPKTGELINADGRMAVQMQGADAYPFYPPTLLPLPLAQMHFNESPVLISTTSGEQDVQAVKAVADDFVGRFRADKSQQEQPLYFSNLNLQDEDDIEIYKRLIQFLQLDGNEQTKRVLILNIPKASIHEERADDATSEPMLRATVDAFLAGTLAAKSLR